MAKFKVRWALISYTGENEPQVLAFRGMTVEDIPEAEAERLLADGAIVAEGAELDMPGTLLPLPVAPSDEELVAWVGSASQTEVLQAVNDRPELSARIKDAWSAYQDAMRAQLEVLGQRIEEIPDVEPEPEAPVNEDDPELTELDAWINNQPDPAAARAELDALNEPPAEQNQVELNDEYFDQVVAQNVDEVQKFIGEYPQFHNEILAAEGRRGDVRVGVEKAVEAAAAFNAQ